jgi:hypothetical protein
VYNVLVVLLYSEYVKTAALLKQASQVISSTDWAAEMTALS